MILDYKHRFLLNSRSGLWSDDHVRSICHQVFIQVVAERFPTHPFFLGIGVSDHAVIALEEEITLNPNIGTFDRVVCAALGITLVSAMVAGLVGFWGSLGIVPLVTTLSGFCPAYRNARNMFLQ